MKKATAFYETINISALSTTARKFFEESDQLALKDLFGKCGTVEEIEATAAELYQTSFGNSEDDI